MTASTPPSSRAADRVPRAVPAEALAWLRSDRRRPPGFAPGEQAAAALEAWTAGGAALDALEARSLAGDSAAARSLAAVHATAAALAPATVDGPLVAALAAPPPGALRDRIVGASRQVLASSDASPPPGPPAEVLAPVIAVGLRHRQRAEEPRRAEAIATLAADVRGGDPVLEQVLERVAAVLDFPLLVVSVVHGAETVHRAFRNTLPVPAPRVVPREASFCTHAVADDAPLVIADAAADPFFAQHPAVGAFGLVAYCGVPLRAGAAGFASAAVLGTLCGYDVRRRDPAVHDVAVLEVFARRVVAHLEGRGEDEAILDVEASRREGVDLYAAPFFEDLVEILADGAAPRPASLLVGAPGAPLVGGDPRLVGGRIADGRPAWLLAGGDAPAARALADDLERRTGAPVAVASAADFAG